MRKQLLFCLILSFFCVSLNAQEEINNVINPDAEAESVIKTENTTDSQVKAFQNHIIPVLGFNTLQTDEKDFMLQPSVTLQFMRAKNSEVESKQPDMIALAAGYSQNYFTSGLGEDNVKTLHGVNVMGTLSQGKNNYTVIAGSTGQIPFSDIRIVSGGAMYTRQMVKSDHIEFLFGGGIFVGDLGIKIKERDIFVFPFPVFSFTYKNEYFSGSISIMGTPGINIVLFPKSMFRIKGYLSTAGFKSVRDINFDCALVCYPLLNTPAKEFLSLSAGIMNKNSKFRLKDNTTYKYQSYTVYGEINASFISLRVGYNFNGQLTYDDDVKKALYKGLTASVQAMYMF